MSRRTPSSRSGIAIRKALAKSIHRSKRTRADIASAMTSVLGIRITVLMLNDYTAASHLAHRWPAEFDIAFCLAVDDWQLLHARVKAAGFRMIGPEEERFISIGKAFLQASQAERFLSKEAAR